MPRVYLIVLISPSNAIDLPMSDLKHKQAPIFEEGEVIFHVDEKLQSLMQFFWDTGIQTLNSCQDNVRGTCWIEFEMTDWMMLSDISFKSAEQTFTDLSKSTAKFCCCHKMTAISMTMTRAGLKEKNLFGLHP